MLITTIDSEPYLSKTPRLTVAKQRHVNFPDVCGTMVRGSLPCSIGYGLANPKGLDAQDRARLLPTRRLLGMVYASNEVGPRVGFAFVCGCFLLVRPMSLEHTCAEGDEIPSALRTGGRGEPPLPDSCGNQ